MSESEKKEKNLKETSDWGSPQEILSGVMKALEEQVEWPLTEIMEKEEVHALLAPLKEKLNQKMKHGTSVTQMNEMSKPEIKAKHKKAKEAMPYFQKQYGKEKGEKIAYATAMSGKMDEEKGTSYEDSGLEKPELADRNKNKKIEKWEKTVAKNIEASEKEEQKEIKVNEALTNSYNYSTVTRAMPETAAARDEFVFQELMRKFKIKK